MVDFKLWLESNEYSCVMLKIPKKEILKWSKENISKQNLHEKGRELDTHVTVLYGLHTNDLKDVVDIDFPEIEITLGNVTKFSQPEYDVIKIDVESKSIRKANELVSELDHEKLYPKYHPHCTLAYVKKDSCNHLIGNDYFKGKKLKGKLVFSNKSRKHFNLD